MNSSRRRFYIKPNDVLDLNDGGFLADPDTEFGQFGSSAIRRFEDIESLACLCFLGEPGMGKSTTLTSLHSGCIKPAKFVDLRPYSTSQDLRAAVFESPEYRDWLQGQHVLTPFLDSLDECLLRVDNAAAVLIEGLSSAPTERLHLRIASRTSDWQQTLEKRLREKYGDAAVGVFELAPLRRIDVLNEAEAGGVSDPAGFLTEVIQREAVPLAVKPISLNFLIKEYKSSRGLPLTRSKLYEQGCLCLCDESSETRIDASPCQVPSVNP